MTISRAHLQQMIAAVEQSTTDAAAAAATATATAVSATSAVASAAAASVADAAVAAAAAASSSSQQLQWQFFGCDLWTLLIGFGLVTTAVLLGCSKSAAWQWRRRQCMAWCSFDKRRRRNSDDEQTRAEPLLLFAPNRNAPTNQGLEWSNRALKQDKDGDQAHEFLGPF